MPFKSEAQRKYLWANEPEIARDWTDTYGSRIQKEGGGLTHNFENYAYDDGGNVSVPRSFQARAGSDPVNLAYVTPQEEGILQSLKPGTPHRGPMEIPNYDAFDARGNYATSQQHDAPTRGDVRAGVGSTTGGGAGDTRIATIKQDIRDVGRGVRPAGYNVNQFQSSPTLGSGIAGGWQKFLNRMRTVDGVVRDQDYFSEDERDKRRNQASINTIMNREAPITDLTHKRLGQLGYEGTLPGLKSTRTSRAIDKDYDINEAISEYPITSKRIQDLQNQRITGTDAYEKFSPDVALSKQMGSLQAGAIPYETFGANEQDDLSQGWESAKLTGLALGQMRVLEKKEAAPEIYGPLDEKGKKFLDKLKKMDKEEKVYSKPILTVAQGGRIGYQGGNMVGAEMEGAEMEGAMMQSQEVIKELYDALIAQGLSPQEAIEKIKEIIASSQTQEPESPMMGEEFPGQEFGGGPRIPAAFGGIMDTYTGRRKYLFGSFNPFKVVKKAVKKLKKLASSKFGKIALGYLATAGISNYLAGAQGTFGLGAGQGQAWKSMKWLNPSNIVSNVGTSWGKLPFNQTAPIKQIADTSRILPMAKPGAKEMMKLAMETEAAQVLGTPAAKSLVPGVSNKALAMIGIPAITAGAVTKYQQPEELGGEVTEEYDTDLQKWKDYYAGLNAEYSVNPALLKSAQGGRVGRQEGGLMDLGGMEKDYRDDGGFVPLGGEEKADDVPARLSKNEFVFTADAVRNAGGGDIDRGAEVMENVMKNLEAGGKVSEESQGQGAEEMFEVSERLSEVI